MTKSQMEVAVEEFGLELTCSFGLYRILDNGVEVATATHTCQEPPAPPAGCPYQRAAQAAKQACALHCG